MDGLIVVVWVGLDTGGRLGLTGAQAAVPMFERFASSTHRLFSEPTALAPVTVHEAWVDPSTGWRTESNASGALVVFRGVACRKKTVWKDGVTALK